MSGPKADRLKLFQATGMNLSPVFGLYPDEAGEVQATLDAAVGRALPLEATDHLGVVSRLWPVTDQHVVSAVTGLMGAEAGVHRRRPPPLRDGSALPRRAPRRRRGARRRAPRRTSS